MSVLNVLNPDKYMGEILYKQLIARQLKYYSYVCTY